MISKVNMYNSDNYRINFKQQQIINKTSSIMLSSQAISNMRSMKSVCRTILTRIAGGSNQFKKSVSEIPNTKITETSISFLASEADKIKLSLPTGVEGKLFRLQVIKDNKPYKSAMFDDDRLVKNTDKNKIVAVTEEDTESILEADTLMKGIYDTVDPLLFDLRKYVHQSLSGQNAVININPVVIPEIITPVVIEERPSPKIAFYMPKFNKPPKTPKTPKTPIYPAAKAKTNPGETLFSYKPIETPAPETPKPSKTLKTPKTPKVSKAASAPKATTALRTPKAQAALKPVKRPTVRRNPVVDNRIEDIGYLSSEHQVKINQIKSLYNSVKEKLAEYTLPTAQKIKQAHNVLSRSNALSFDNVFSIILPNRKPLEKDSMLFIRDDSCNETLAIFKDKILSDKFNPSMHMYSKLIFMNTEELMAKTEDANFNRMLDTSIEKLSKFKEFIENKGWHKRPEERVKPVRKPVIYKHEPGKINEETMKKFAQIRELKIEIKNFLRKYSKAAAVVIQRRFGRIRFTEHRVFSGKNLIIKFFPNGSLIKLSDTKNQKTYTILDDRIIKNPKGQNENKFYFQEEIENEGLQQNIDEKLDTVLENLKEYKEYLNKGGWLYKRGRKKISTSQVEQPVSKKINDKNIGVIETMVKDLKKQLKRIENHIQDLKSSSESEN